MTLFTTLVLALAGLAVLVVLVEAFLGTVLAALDDRHDAALVRARAARRHPGPGRP